MFTLTNSLYSQSVGLVLSGGGAKGLSHIGVIKALEENNIPIDYVCGTSMGAIIGALYSIGLSPDEMLYLFRTKEFESWYKGLPEQGYATYFYRDDPAPKMFSFSFSNKKGKLKVDLPTSLVPPYFMDLAVLQIFASPSDACKYNFDSLMTPFFCVASDIIRKKPSIHTNGDLGSAVRASMTYPFYFKPITIDTTLLFDGGFYNNFPWDIMEERFSPNFIIGSKCVIGSTPLDEEDVVTQVTNMLMYQTDYQIPSEKGLVIGRTYPYSIMDFAKVDEIVKLGYDNAQAYIAQIKQKVTRERSATQLDSMRLAFRRKCGEVRFSKDINFSGNLNHTQQRFISRTIRNDEMKSFDFDKFKRGYYRVIASKTVRTFYPSYKRLNDSLYTLNLKVTKASPFSLSVGGNISSSSLNQGYIGASYTHMATNPWRLTGDINVGKFYKGGGIKFRKDIGVSPLAFYDAEFVLHQFDYYSGNQNLFTPDRVPNNAQQREAFARIGIATALSLKRNILAKFNVHFGQNHYKYYPNEYYSKDDVADVTKLNIISPSASLYRNTQNYELYPSQGRRDLLSIRWIWGSESYNPGTTLLDKSPFSGAKHNTLQLKLFSEAYANVCRFFHIGYVFDFTLSSKNLMSDYLSSLLYMPAFEPIPHSKTLLLKGYRANNYIGLGISPVILFTKTLFLHTNLSYFQAYQQIYELEDGVYDFTEKYPKGSFMGNLALVWQSPIGPVSFSASYYQRGEYKKWYPQFNVGFLLFKKKSLED